MKSVRYTKYIGDLASEMDLESLLQALSEYLLDSGFRDPYARFQELDHNLDDLREALRRILQSGEFLNQEMQQQIDQMAAEGTLDEFIDKLIERMQQENYISSSAPAGRDEHVASRAGRWATCRAKSASKSPTRVSIFWATKRCAICWARWESRVSAAMTRGTGPRASKSAAARSGTSSATR